MAQKKIVLAIGARRFSKRAFGQQTSYLRGLLRIARRSGMRAYVFEPGGINWSRRTVRGWIRGKSRTGWIRRTCPWPDVVYDRVWNIPPAVRRRYENDLLRLHQETDVPAFNPSWGHKLDLHRILSQNPDILDHLPHTLPLDAENVRSLLDTYDSLFIKPRSGRQGRRISKCTKTRQRYHIRRRLASGRIVRSWTSSPSGIVALSRGKGSAEDYLVQQGLDLLHVRGGAVDIRAIAQRNAAGTWSITGVGARVGPRGGFVSNLHAGGQAYTLSRLCRHARVRQGSRRLASRIEDLVLATVAHLTQHFPSLGEVGIDIGLDTAGHLWILEVNRQPGRALFARAKLYTSWRRSRLRIIQFSRYLAKAGISSCSSLSPPPYDETEDRT